MSTVCSFDVFDTVLTRRVGSPHAVFDLLGQQLASEGRIPTSAVAFARERRRHEERLTRLLGRHQTLRTIHLEVARALSVDPSAAETWASAEEDLERRLTVAVPGAARMLDEARARSDRVVFVSDTPHTEEFLTELLVARGLALPQDLVFTSAQRGVSKSSGGLFDAVAREIGENNVFEHVGDNRRSDLAAARAEGWSGEHVGRAALTRYEELLEKHSLETSSFSSWLAGASRLARLEATERGVAAPVAEVASGALAPFLVGYALWTAAQARLRGIKRLYYVARDGEVMFKVAQHVIGSLAPEIELRYLYGSRQAWVLAASAHSDEVLRRWIKVPTDSTARTALDRVCLTPEQAFQLTKLPFTAPGQADRPLLPAERTELARCLMEEPLLSHVRAAAEAASERAVAYFRQEGLHDGTPSALVDAGWGGRSSRAFDVVQAAAGGPQVTHLFVGMTGKAEDAPEHRDVAIVPWLFNQQIHPDSVADLQAPNVLVEMLCAGTVGRTQGYEQTGDRVEPVLGSPVNEPVVAWGIRDVQEVAVRTAELATESLSDLPTAIDCAPLVWEVLGAFWNWPSSAEVKTWGMFPWEDELSRPFEPVAERITTRGVVLRWMRGDRHLRRNNSWRAGTAGRSSQPWRSILQGKAWADRNRHRLRRLPRRVRLELAQRRRR